MPNWTDKDRRMNILKKARSNVDVQKRSPKRSLVARQTNTVASKAEPQSAPLKAREIRTRDWKNVASMNYEI